MKDRIRWINETAQTNWEKAKGMLDIFNDIYGTQYEWLNKRVVVYDKPGDMPNFLKGEAHDALCTLY